MEDKKKPVRFPLALPPDVDRAVREYAKGDAKRAPTSLNNALVFLVRKGLEAVLKENAPGQPNAAQAGRFPATRAA